MTKRVFISADHGLALIYFLQSDVISTLIKGGTEVILFTAGSLKSKVNERFGQSGLIIEDLRLEAATKYAQEEHGAIQWWLNFFRRAGPSARMNLETVNNYVHWIETESKGMRKKIFPLVKAGVWLMRHSRIVRKILVNMQNQFTPDIYGDYFERYKPDLVIGSTPGWRLDRYLLREAAARGIQTAAIVQGWDNPSSHALPGAKVEWITCWSQPQKEELINGSDWQSNQINIGGIPAYDGYFEQRWLMPKKEYYRLHNLDPNKKLLGYACSFVTYSPNIQNIRALIDLVVSDRLAEPCQLLIRLHPNHFTNVPRWANEREQIRELVGEYSDVYLVEPVPLGEEFGYYSGEDMPEKTSMMAYSDVFLTVYSTMVVEASIHERPIVSVTINSETGWSGQYSLKLTEIGKWPTHSRFRASGAGLVVSDKDALCDAINTYLKDPKIDLDAQRAFIKRECTFTDGSSGRRTGEYFLSLIK
ncbi:MAG: CDP-glycerol glycerophosphotransferase family protein [Anaerolineales bacterium]|nr:CDP-glycerol glycerophosphotransferase family protein [Anaerolineales bacterium]